MNHGYVDTGSAAPGRCPSPDAGLVRPAFPHRGATLFITVDRKPSLVGEQLLDHLLGSTRILNFDEKNVLTETLKVVSNLGLVVPTCNRHDPS